MNLKGNQEFENKGGGFEAMKSERRQQIRRVFDQAAQLAPR